MAEQNEILSKNTEFIQAQTSEVDDDDDDDKNDSRAV